MTQPEQKPNYTEFSDPRLAGLYDTLNPFGADSEFFCNQAKELGAVFTIFFPKIVTENISKREVLQKILGASIIVLGIIVLNLS